MFDVINNMIEIRDIKKEFHKRLVILNNKDKDINIKSDKDNVRLNPSLIATPLRSFNQRQVSVRRTV
jgi:hypothetical protein